MRKLLAISAAIELGAGVGLLAFPPLVVNLLLGEEISGAAIPLGRVAGMALLALGVACWLAHGETQNRAARGLLVAMLVCNLGVVAVLLFAALGARLAGIALWPAVILHGAMAAGCLVCLRCRRSNRDNGA